MVYIKVSWLPSRHRVHHECADHVPQLTRDLFPEPFVSIGPGWAIYSESISAVPAAAWVMGAMRWRARVYSRSIVGVPV